MENEKKKAVDPFARPIVRDNGDPIPYPTLIDQALEAAMEGLLSQGRSGMRSALWIHIDRAMDWYKERTGKMADPPDKSLIAITDAEREIIADGLLRAESYYAEYARRRSGVSSLTEECWVNSKDAKNLFNRLTEGDFRKDAS
jgi:hypothetical protein